MLQLSSNSVDATISIANKIASVLNSGDLIILDGNMGAGKTHFVKGIAQHFNYSGKVISPTFNIANFYTGDNITILHIDLYRIEDEKEFDDLGITEYFDNSIVFMEWGKKIVDNFDNYLFISFELDETDYNKRKISLKAKGEKYEKKIIDISQINFNNT